MRSVSRASILPRRTGSRSSLEHSTLDGLHAFGSALQAELKGEMAELRDEFRSEMAKLRVDTQWLMVGAMAANTVAVVAALLT